MTFQGNATMLDSNSKLYLSQLIDFAIEHNALIIYPSKTVELKQGVKAWEISFPDSDKIKWQGANSFEEILKRFIDIQRKHIEDLNEKCNTLFYCDRQTDLMLTNSIIVDMIEYGGKHIDLNWARNQYAKLQIDLQYVKVKGKKQYKKTADIIIELAIIGSLSAIITSLMWFGSWYIPKIEILNLGKRECDRQVQIANSGTEAEKEAVLAQEREFICNRAYSVLENGK